MNIQNQDFSYEMRTFQWLKSKHLAWTCDKENVCMLVVPRHYVASNHAKDFYGLQNHVSIQFYFNFFHFFSIQIFEIMFET